MRSAARRGLVSDWSTMSRVDRITSAPAAGAPTPAPSWPRGCLPPGAAPATLGPAALGLVEQLVEVERREGREELARDPGADARLDGPHLIKFLYRGDRDRLAGSVRPAPCGRSDGRRCLDRAARRKLTTRADALDVQAARGEVGRHEEADLPARGTPAARGPGRPASCPRGAADTVCPRFSSCLATCFARCLVRAKMMALAASSDSTMVTQELGSRRGPDGVQRVLDGLGGPRVSEIDDLGLLEHAAEPGPGPPPAWSPRRTSSGAHRAHARGCAGHPGGSPCRGADPPRRGRAPRHPPRSQVPSRTRSRSRPAQATSTSHPASSASRCRSIFTPP